MQQGVGALWPASAPVAVRTQLAAFAGWARRHALVLAVSVSVPVAGMALFFVGFPFFHPGTWYVDQDHWYAIQQARFVYFGATGAVYESNSYTSALPGLPILYAPAVALADHLNLVQGVPYFVKHPTMWLAVGPEAYAVGSFMVWGIDALAAQLGVPTSRRRLLVVSTGLLVVLPAVDLAGHPEDCAALGMLCFALAAHLRGEDRKVGWWLSAAILMQTWVLLVCPVLFFATPSGRRVGMAVRAALFPVLVFSACLAATPALAWRQVVSVQPMPRDGQFTPWYAIAPRLARHHEVAGESSRRWAALLAAALGSIGLRRPSPRTVLLIASGVLLVRPLFETSDWGYYSMPGLVLAAVVAAASPRRSWYWLLGAAVVLSGPTYGYWYLPRMSPWLFLAVLAASSAGVLAWSAHVTKQALAGPSPPASDVARAGAVPV